MFRFLASVLVPLSLFAAAAGAEQPAVRATILVYHRLGPAVADEMTVRTAVFEEQLRLIEQRGHRVVSLRTVVGALDDVSSRALPEHAVALTVDDGHYSVYRELFPLLKRHRLPMTLFIYPSAISNASYAMTWAQLAEMQASGLVEVQSHTFWHPNFNTERKRLSSADYERFVHEQFAKSKAVLEMRLGGTVDLLAWPFGIYDEQLMQRAQSAGYRAAFTIERRPATRADKLMALPRYLVVDADRGRRFEAVLEGH